MSFDSSAQNKLPVAAPGEPSNLRSMPSTSGQIMAQVPAGKSIGILTGEYNAMPDGRWYQVRLSSAINGRLFGYMREDVIIITSPPPPSTSTIETTQEMMNALARQDKAIAENVRESLQMLLILKRQGRRVDQPMEEVRKIYNAWAARQAALKTDPALKVKSSLDQFHAWVKTYFGISGNIGALPVVLLDIVVVAGLALVVYYTWKSHFEKSGHEVKISQDIKEAIISQLGEDRYNSFVKEQQDQLDDAYREGKSDGGDSLFGTLKTLGYVFIGWQIISLVREERAHSRSKAA